MDLQDVVFLSSKGSFTPQFVIEVKAPGPPHVLKQGHAACKVLSLKQSLFLCQLNFMEIIRLSQR